MNPGSVLAGLVKALRLTPAQIQRIFRLEGIEPEEARLRQWLEDETAGYEELGRFLDGLIRIRRGTPKLPSDDEIVLDNNLVIKKLRIALELKELDTRAIFELGGLTLSRSRYRDLFRNPAHPKYLQCSGGCLRCFLEGLEEFCLDLPPGRLLPDR